MSVIVHFDSPNISRHRHCPGAVLFPVARFVRCGARPDYVVAEGGEKSFGSTWSVSCCLHRASSAWRTRSMIHARTISSRSNTLMFFRMKLNTKVIMVKPRKLDGYWFGFGDQVIFEIEGIEYHLDVGREFMRDKNGIYG